MIRAIAMPLEEMEDMNIKWLSEIFSLRNILEKEEPWASAQYANSISAHTGTRREDVKDFKGPPAAGSKKTSYTLIHF
jgi:hypothetical protein